MDRKSRRPAAVACLVAALTALSACSSSSSNNGTSATPSSSAPAVASSAAPAVSASTSSADASACGTSEPTTVTIGLFGTFGYKENGLYDAYKTVCPNITIKEDVIEQSAEYWTKLKTHLAAGSGLDDVQAIEVGFVADIVKNHADQFVNFQAQPNAADLKASFYGWKCGTGDHDRRQDHCRTGHGLRPAGHLLPARPAQAGRSAVEPAGGCGQDEDLGGLHRPRQAVRGLPDQAQGLELRRQRGERLLHRRLPGQRGLRQRSR